jgi:hypothetical protein
MQLLFDGSVWPEGSAQGISRVPERLRGNEDFVTKPTGLIPDLIDSTPGLKVVFSDPVRLSSDLTILFIKYCVTLQNPRDYLSQRFHLQAQSFQLQT